MKRFAMISIGVVVAVSTVNACSSATEDGLYPCDPKAIRPAPECLEQASNTSDAGTDADADIAMSAREEIPGFTPESWPLCKGECKPKPSDVSGGDWSSIPQLVWFGPASAMPENCPNEVPAMLWRRFAGLVAPPAKCDACACSPEGSCTGLPASIELRSGSCNASNAGTTPFNGPTSWNGSCTSANAIAAGTLCNGVLCAQSVSASPLPAPTNESCFATTEKPAATLGKHKWLDGALACDRKDVEGTCGTNSDHCRPSMPSPWLHCVYRKGIHDVCPDNYQDEKGPRWYYDDNPIDDRGCSDCACGTPKDGICVGSLSVYSDGACVSEFVKLPLSSVDPSCGTITPPGRAVGSKTIDGIAYVPGSCAVTGGKPIGAVIPNADEMAGAVTFCCRAPEPPQEQPE